MRYYLFVILLLLYTNAGAQQVLSEGTIIYSVSIGPVAGGTTFTEHAGTYTITIKGRQVRKELSMNTGYKAVIITNGNTGVAYSLRSSGGQTLRYSSGKKTSRRSKNPIQDLRWASLPAAVP